MVIEELFLSVLSLFLMPLLVFVPLKLIARFFRDRSV